MCIYKRKLIIYQLNCTNVNRSDMHFHLNFMTMNFYVCVRPCVCTHLTCFSINDFRSPLSGLHIRYDSSGPLVPGLGSGSDTLPPGVTSIDQLLDRQWNEGQQFLLQQGSQGDGERLFYTHIMMHFALNHNSSTELFIYVLCVCHCAGLAEDVVER